MNACSKKSRRLIQWISLESKSLSAFCSPDADVTFDRTTVGKHANRAGFGIRHPRSSRDASRVPLPRHHTPHSVTRRAPAASQTPPPFSDFGISSSHEHHSNADRIRRLPVPVKPLPDAPTVTMATSMSCSVRVPGGSFTGVALRASKRLPLRCGRSAVVKVNAKTVDEGKALSQLPRAAGRIGAITRPTVYHGRNCYWRTVVKRHRAPCHFTRGHTPVPLPIPGTLFTTTD